MVRATSRFVLAVLAALACGAASAQDDAPDDAHDYEHGTLSGDWNGSRTDLHERGVALDLGYKWDMLRVVDGGLGRGGRPMGQFDLKAKGDLNKLAGWENVTAYVNFIYDGGGKTNRDQLGSLLTISNIEVPVSTGRLFHAWVEREFADGQWAVLGGLYPIDSEFQVLDSAGVFVQPPYGAAPDLALTRGPSIFNNSAVGLRGKWLSADRTVYAQAAVLDGIPGDSTHPRGTHIKFERGDGTMQIAELGYKPRELGHVFEPTTPERGVTPEPEIKVHEPYEGYDKYAVGFWRYTALADDLVDVDAAGRPQRRRSSGWYVLAERTQWQWDGGDAALFFRYGATDGNSSAIARFHNIGLRVRGLLPGREDDFFGIAYTRGAVGAKFRASQSALGVATTEAESAAEINYRIQATKWLAVQPLLQFFRHPGAVDAVPQATVVGVRVELAL